MSRVKDLFGRMKRAGILRSREAVVIMVALGLFGSCERRESGALEKESAILENYLGDLDSLGIAIVEAETLSLPMDFTRVYKVSLTAKARDWVLERDRLPESHPSHQDFIHWIDSFLPSFDETKAYEIRYLHSGRVYVIVATESGRRDIEEGFMLVFDS